MRLLLVDNLILPARGSLATMDLHPHLGLLALAAAAAAQGHVTTIYDPKRLLHSGHLPYDDTLYERVAHELLASAPQAVGFTTLGCSFLFALNVAAELKRREPDLPILLGGPHATMLHASILERFPQFDLVARHECDEVIAPLLEALPSRRLAHLPGLSWRDGRRLRYTEGRPKVEDLDTLPFLDYDHYPVAALGLELLRIEAGRGCPFMCTFCSTAGFFQRSFRLKSAPRLVQELDRLHRRYGVRDFKLDHDMFTVNRHKVLEFCQAVRGRGYRWRVSARVDCVDEALLEAMAEAGCVDLYFGIETGSARMQRLCGKRLDLTRVQPMFRAAERLGIAATASFITGYPEETQADQDDTLDLLGRLHGPRCLTQLHMLAPEPGTPLFDRHGGALGYDGYGGPYNTDLMTPGDEAWVRGHPDIFPTYHHYPATLPRRHLVFATEAVATLRRLGPLVLRYLLRADGGRLSVLVRDWRGFSDSLGTSDAPPGAEDLIAYLGRRFGTDHHLVSLVRYALCLHGGGDERGGPAPPPPEPFDPNRSYRLQPQARVLVDLHDCEHVLQRIRECPADAALLDDAQFAQRRSYLVARRGAGAVSWCLEPGAAHLVSLFEQPRRCTEVVEWMRQAAGGATVDVAFFATLAREQVLVAAMQGDPA
ncbi:MAG: B12-binding domain-containing radical SAM protein [Betaproteobacteria bacterium]